MFDSNECIRFFSEKLGRSIDRHLDKQKLAIARAVQFLVEDSLKWCIAYHRYLNEKDERFKQIEIGELNSKNIKKELNKHYMYKR
jgi:hypothetical protein